MVFVLFEAKHLQHETVENGDAAEGNVYFKTYVTVT